MKYRVILIVLSIALSLSEMVISAEKTYIVGFHKRPGPSERALIHGARGLIKRSYSLIPAMSVRLSEEQAAKLSKIPYSQNCSLLQHIGTF